MIIEATNLVHSLADSARMREALRAHEVSVVIGVALTETAREADYVLPASSQFEKAEASFFNFEAEANAFQLRRTMPRFAEANWPINLALVDAFNAVAAREGVTPAQLSLGWVLAQGEHIVAVAGPRCGPVMQATIDTEDFPEEPARSG